MGLRGHHKATTVTVKTASFLVVRLGKNFYALPSHGVRGVLTREEAGSGQTVTAVGVTYLDLDLAGRLAIAVDFTQPDTRTVLYSNGHSHGAIRVEEVIGMVDVERDQCKPLPPHFRQEERTWISGTFFFQEHLVLALYPEWVLRELGEVVGAGAVGIRAKVLEPATPQGDTC